MQGELLLQATVRIACLDARSLKPRRLPQVIVHELRSVVAKE
jgi:acyl-CoA thioesterase FadM